MTNYFLVFYVWNHAFYPVLSHSRTHSTDTHPRAHAERNLLSALPRDLSIKSFFSWKVTWHFSVARFLKQFNLKIHYYRDAAEHYRETHRLGIHTRLLSLSLSLS